VLPEQVPPVERDALRVNIASSGAASAYIITGAVKKNGGTVMPAARLACADVRGRRRNQVASAILRELPGFYGFD
jgi:hypothetical protein